MGRLAANIVTRNPDTGTVEVFEAGTEPPEWVEVTNPDVWADAAATADVPTSGDRPPPQAGRGSGRDAWAAYAEAHGADVDDEANRDDIIAALVNAGIPTE